MRWLTNPVVQFLATGFVTLVVVLVATSALSRSAADEEAIADARSLTRVLGTSVAEPAVPPGLVSGDAAAIDRFDRSALDRLLVDDVLPDQDLGRRRDHPLQRPHRADRRDLPARRRRARGGPRRRHRRRALRPRPAGEPLRARARRRPPRGLHAHPLARGRAAAVRGLPRRRPDPRAAGRRCSTASCPSPSASLLALVALSTPLVVLLSRRLSRAARERERLLEAAVRASDASGCASRATCTTAWSRTWRARRWPCPRWRPASTRGERRDLEEIGRSLRVSMRSLRSLLVEIYPPDLHTDRHRRGARRPRRAPGRLPGSRSTSTSAATRTPRAPPWRSCGGPPRSPCATWPGTPARAACR